MEYRGSTFKSDWKDNLLSLEIYVFNDEMVNLLEIVLDAAEKQGPYRILWDFRPARHPGYMALPRLIYRATKLYSMIKHAERGSVLVADRYYKYAKTIMRAINSNDTSYIGCNPIEALEFVN